MLFLKSRKSHKTQDSRYEKKKQIQPIIGIDFGTSKSLVGYWNKDLPQIITDVYGDYSIPSKVLITREGKYYIGKDAERYSSRYDWNIITINSIKRLIGKKGLTDWLWWKTYPQEIAAFILANLKYMAENQLKNRIEKAVIAIPSNYDESQRHATIEAAEIAGLDTVRLLNEANAAALTYYDLKRTNGTILIFDFGAGSLDVSIVNMGDNLIEVVAVDGDGQLGGDDFDKVIYDIILDKIDYSYGEIELNQKQHNLLWISSEHAKIDLSQKTTAEIFIPGFFGAPSSLKDLRIEIDRSLFESNAQNLFNRTVAIVDSVLSNARGYPESLGAVLTIGGTSRIPFIRNYLEKRFDQKVFRGVDSETCVVHGAILTGAFMSGEKIDFLLLDVLPSFYGIAINNREIITFLKKNTTIPAMETINIIIRRAHNGIATYPIYRWKKSDYSDRAYLGSLEIEVGEVSISNPERVEISFEVGPDMAIFVRVISCRTGKVMERKIGPLFALTGEQKEEIKERLRGQVWAST